MGSQLSFPKRPFATRGGAKVPHRKGTAAMQSVAITPPEEVVIPMCQHIGAPCKVTVKVNDLVDAGQVIGDTDQFVSAPIHASISGKVTKITQLTMTNGNKCDAVVIASDGEMRMSPDIQPPVINSTADFINAVRASGLVGLGGAGFPAHVKLNVPNDKNIDTLIINVAECEPYITADHREALENSWAVMSGIYAVKEILDVHRVIIGVENNKPDVIKVLREIADNASADPKDEVRVLPLKSAYPQGAEKVLVQACTGRKIPIGKLPADVGCIVMNVTSVAFIANYLKTGIPLISKRITVDGSAIAEPKNVIVPIGTPIKTVIDFCGGFQQDPKKIVMGGPMMGIALTDDTMPILKQNNAILAFNEQEAKLMESTNCIRCGKCVLVCPMGLVPAQLNIAVKAKDTETLDKLSVMTCMECGCCSFYCPAGIHLVQNFRLGKTMLKSRQVKETGGKSNG